MPHDTSPQTAALHAFPPGFLGSGVVLSDSVELRSTIEVDGVPVHIPVAELEAIEQAFRRGPYDRDGELLSYALPFRGQMVNVEIGWGHDSFAFCDRPSGLLPHEERLLEAIVKGLADAQWDADCEVSP